MVAITLATCNILIILPIVNGICILTLLIDHNSTIYWDMGAFFKWSPLCAQHMMTLWWSIAGLGRLIGLIILIGLIMDELIYAK